MIYISKLFSPISTGTSAGDIDVGATVKINENGQPVEHIVVHQGLPSDIYDSSCEGTWCLRKDIAEERQWNSSNVNDYANSTIKAYLNGDWLNRYDPEVVEAIKQVKIPYRQNGGSGGTDQTGANGFPCKIFLLSGREVGFTNNESSYFPNDGAKLDYFISGNDSSAQQKRIAKLNGSATDWWLRSPHADGRVNVWDCDSNGNGSVWSADDSCGVRPALILPYSFKFKEVS